jgi:hypothetical protein
VQVNILLTVRTSDHRRYKEMKGGKNYLSEERRERMREKERSRGCGWNCK